MKTAEEQVSEAKRVIQEWLDKQGHDRCWYYPDLFQTLAEILEVRPSKDQQLPPLAEFKKGCERYQREEYTI
jgi:hypothetical protein